MRKTVPKSQVKMWAQFITQVCSEIDKNTLGRPIEML